MKIYLATRIVFPILAVISATLVAINFLFYSTALAWITGATIVITVFVTTPAYAYLDPGTGSYILQVINAALLGMAYLVKVYWKKILVFLRRLFPKMSKTSNDDD